MTISPCILEITNKRLCSHIYLDPNILYPVFRAQVSSPNHPAPKCRSSFAHVAVIDTTRSVERGVIFYLILLSLIYYIGTTHYYTLYYGVSIAFYIFYRALMHINLVLRTFITRLRHGNVLRLCIAHGIKLVCCSPVVL